MRCIKKFWFAKMKNNLIFILFVLVWIFTIQLVLLYYYHYFNSVNKFNNNLPKKSLSSSNMEVKLQKLSSHETSATTAQKLALPPQQQQATNESTINIMLQNIKKYVNSENYPRLKQLISSVGFATTQKKPPLYIITPTWARPVQISELTRLGYTLKVLKILKILKKYHIL